MFSLKKQFVAFLGLTALIGVVALVMPRPTQGQGGNTKAPSDVNVVNTPTVNVGNTPSVNVANTSPLSVQGTVAATQSGPWAVELVGTPAVSLSQSAPAQPFDAKAVLDCCNGSPTASEVLFVVPEGKTVVIETVSAWFSSELGMVPRLNISQAIIGVQSSEHFVALTQQGTAAAPSRPGVERSIHAGTQTLRLYALPGSEVRATVFVPMLMQGDPPAKLIGVVFVTGYFVDTPTAGGN